MLIQSGSEPMSGRVSASSSAAIRQPCSQASWSVPRNAQWLLLVLFACQAAPHRTQTVVFVDAVRGIREATQVTRVIVQSADDRAQRLDETVQPKWPIKLVLAPLANDSSRGYRVMVTVLDEQRRTRVSVTLVSGFVAGQTRFVEIVLADSCDGASVSEVLTIQPEQLGPRENEPTQLRTCHGLSDAPRNGATEPDTSEPDASANHETAEMAPKSSFASSGSGGAAGTAGMGAARNGAAGGADDAGCAPGYSVVANGCADTDECSINNAGCPQQCINLAGSFRCGCSQSAMPMGDAGCPRWHAAVRLDPSHPASGSAPKIGMDAHGDAWVAWSRTSQSNRPSSLWAVRFVPSSGWQSALQLEDVSDSVYDVELATAASGDSLLAWTQSASTSSVWAKRFTPTTGWSAADNLGDPTRIEDAVRLAIGATGDALALWSRSGGDRPELWFNHFTKSAGWDGAAALKDDVTGSIRFDELVVHDDQGAAIVVWNRFDGAYEQIYSRRFTKASGWTAASAVESSPGYSSFPDFAVSVDGSAIAVWEKVAGAPPASTQLGVIWANRYTPESGWQSASAIEVDSNESSSFPKVAVDAHGDGFAVWSKQQMIGVDALSTIWANHFTPTGGWGSPQRISVDPTRGSGGGAYEARIGVDAYGNAIAVWGQAGSRTTSESSIWTNRYVAGLGWSTPIRLDDNIATNVHPDIAIDADGRAIAVWNRQDVPEGQRDGPWAARFE
jgi:hypothetical protein